MTTDTLPPTDATETPDPVAAERAKREAWREETTAMVFLDVYGSQSSLDKPWTWVDADGTGHSYRFVNEGCPEWLSGYDSPLPSDVDPDACVCVLTTIVGSDPADAPPGYRVVSSYQAGEHDCPECEGRGTLGHEEYVPEDLRGKACPLCEGDRFLYWGEEWQVVVFAPRYSYGSGMSGCTYDNGPHTATSKEEAIRALVETFEDYFEAIANEWLDLDQDSSDYVDSEDCERKAEAEEQAMRAALKADGCYRFTRPDLAGADYCEIVDLTQK